MNKIAINELGRAVARSGLLPVTAHYFIEYLRDHAKDLKALMPRATASKDGLPEVDFDPIDSAFVLIHLSFTSPEFGGRGVAARRRIPFQLGEARNSPRALKLNSLLAVRPWDRDVLAVNAADITIDWISGVSLIELEGRFERLRAGVLRDMYRTLIGHLTGFAEIVIGMIVASDGRNLPNEYAWVARERGLLFRTVRRLRQIARSVGRGVPEELLWLADLEDARNRPLCRRPELIACHRRQLRTLEEVVDPGRKTTLIEALKDAQSDPERWKGIRAGALEYRARRTETRKASHIRRLPKECEAIVSDYYTTRGVPFENVLERCIQSAGIKILDRDDASKKGKSFPDFVIELDGRRLVIECKSSEGEEDIPLGTASEIFKKAGIHNFNTEPLVTVCQPYVATDAPRKIESSERLTVVNAEDLAEGLVRIYLKKLHPARFFNWITTPGQPRYEELSA